MCGLIVAGCEKKAEYTFYPTYPVVTWDQLAERPNVDVDDGYRVLTSGMTQGVFPTSLAVARLVAQRGLNDENVLMLDMKPQVDFLAWNSNFDDFRAVSEVFPMNQMAMDGDAVNIHTLLENSADLRAGTLLVYSEESDSPERYQIRGVLYDVKTQQALASLHTAAYVQDPIAPDAELEPDESVEHLDDRDPRLIAIRRFDLLSRACLMALMSNDESAAPTAPDGWIPARPMEPVIWPPIDDLGTANDPRR
ncbi:MAG: hypothetical protein H6817_08265 [Phycisphaerales bacterium]|nr:hypothetical protein [Phycisphaerales bacterium]